MTGLTAHSPALLGDDRHAVSALAPAARRVLAAVRAVAAEGLTPCVILGQARIEAEGLAAFAAMIGVLRAAGHAAPRVRTLDDACLSPDEEALIDSLAALQEGEPWRAQRHVSGWLPPHAVPRAIGLMAISARHLARAGLTLTPSGAVHTLH
jgi:hypothetical protein